MCKITEKSFLAKNDYQQMQENNNIEAWKFDNIDVFYFSVVLADRKTTLWQFIDKTFVISNFFCIFDHFKAIFGLTFSETRTQCIHHVHLHGRVVEFTVFPFQSLHVALLWMKKKPKIQCIFDTVVKHVQLCTMVIWSLLLSKLH